MIEVAALLFASYAVARSIPRWCSGALRIAAGPSLAVHRWTVLAILFVMIAAIVARSVGSPRGALRVLVSRYVATVDAADRWMFRAPSGVKLAWSQAIGLTFALALHGVTGQWGPVALAAAIAIVPPVLVGRKVSARRAQIDEQAHGFALALGNALKATASIGDALRTATDVTAKPLQDELSLALRQVRVGATLEQALLSLSARVRSGALDVVVSALLIGRQTGGDLPRILEGTAASLRELKRLETLTDRVTRSAKQSLALSAAVTGGLAVGLPMMFPGFLEPLRTTLKGQVYAGQMALVYVLALYLGYRFTRKSI